MYNEARHQKVTASHLQRDAFLYIRQSSVGQVLNNQESARLQYDFRRQAVALGWREEQIKVIDCDQAESAAIKGSRDGFEELVVEVTLQHGGIVMGREVSRLARNNSDWHRLLEMCAFTDTLILDVDGLYDLNNFNDRLVLGLKGMMSEAELHVLRSRLLEGLRNKARRGELKTKLPTGLVYDPADRVVLDPDAQVQQVFRTFFEKFRRIGSAQGTVKEFRREGIKVPRRVKTGELVWGQPTHSFALQVLHNPRYAGAFFHGRTQCRKGPDGRTVTKTLPRDQWQVLIKDKHQGYISWEQYEENERRLRQNSNAHGNERRRSPPREGPALLQGLAICGICGARMTVRYHKRKRRQIPDYMCQRAAIEYGKKRCQEIPGGSIDKAIGKLLLEMVTPLNLQLATSVQAEIESHLEQADQLRRQHVERARYEADLAKRRYMQIDPDNRLVADVLEADWNDRLRQLVEAQTEYEQQREADHKLLTDEQRQKIMALTSDFPELWNDPQTSHRDRKRIVRLLIEDVTIVRDELIILHIRFRGGATRTIELPLPQCPWQMYQTDPDVVVRINELLEHCTDRQTAVTLNREGLRSGRGRAFTARSVLVVRRNHGLKSRSQRLLDCGLIPPNRVADIIGTRPKAVANWRRKGILKGHLADDSNHYMYEPPNDDAVAEIKRRQKGQTRPTALVAQKEEA